jgi:hypothetical protein
MASREQHGIRPDEKPAVDEWGIYDPSQAGLEAVANRLGSERRTAEPGAGKVASSLKGRNRLAVALARDLARKR